MIRRPPRSTLSSSSAASDVYKRQAEDGHVLWPGSNGLGNLDRRGRSQPRRVLAVGQRAARAGEVVAGGAVGAKQVAAKLEVTIGKIHLGNLRTWSERGDVGSHLVDLRAVVLGLLAIGLRPGPSQRHAAAADLEVHGRGADTDQAGGLLRALGVDSVTGRATGLE